MFEVQVNHGMLAVTVGSPESAKGHTHGLLGPFNDDKTDDLTDRNGDTISHTSDLETIYKFGETC